MSVNINFYKLCMECKIPKNIYLTDDNQEWSIVSWCIENNKTKILDQFFNMYEDKKIINNLILKEFNYLMTKDSNLKTSLKTLQHIITLIENNEGFVNNYIYHNVVDMVNVLVEKNKFTWLQYIIEIVNNNQTNKIEKLWEKALYYAVENKNEILINKILLKNPEHISFSPQYKEVYYSSIELSIDKKYNDITKKLLDNYTQKITKEEAIRFIHKSCKTNNTELLSYLFKQPFMNALITNKEKTNNYIKDNNIKPSLIQLDDNINNTEILLILKENGIYEECAVKHILNVYSREKKNDFYLDIIKNVGFPEHVNIEHIITNVIFSNNTEALDYLNIKNNIQHQQNILTTLQMKISNIPFCEDIIKKYISADSIRQWLSNNRPTEKIKVWMNTLILDMELSQKDTIRLDKKMKI